MSNEVHINDQNWQWHVAPLINGERAMRGLIPRDYSSTPLGSYANETSFDLDVDLIPRSEWSERIADMEANKSRLSDMHNYSGHNGGHIKSLDQNGQGFCWAYSTTMAVMLLRMKSNLPYKRLSPHAVACKIYNFQDRGAWGAKSFDFISENGVPDEKLWPQKSMSRSHDNEQTWADAKLHRITEGFIDIHVSHPADAELTEDQIMTLLLMRTPVVLDFSWWGHSVCGLDPVEVDKSRSLNDPRRWGKRIKNSWTDSWGDRGLGVLEGNKAVPMGACAPRVVTAG